MDPGTEIVVVLLGLGGLAGATVGSSVGSGVVVLGGGPFAFNSRGAAVGAVVGVVAAAGGLAWWMRGNTPGGSSTTGTGALPGGRRRGQLNGQL